MNLADNMTQPFQNWTRKSSEILGTVTLHADYRVPVQAVREERERLCKEYKLRDGRVCNLQVTDATERTVVLRALVSARDSGRGPHGEPGGLAGDTVPGAARSGKAGGDTAGSTPGAGGDEA